MAEQKLAVDITNCDRELIHLPGRIQSHGFLIVIDNDFTIYSCSGNITSFLAGSTTELIGRPIDEIERFFSLTYVKGTLEKMLIAGRLNKNFAHINPFVVHINNKPFYLIINDAIDKLLLEFEPALLDSLYDIQKIMGRSITLMLANKTLQELLDNAAVEVKDIIGYDRVMIYKFAEDGHGEVLAEAMNDGLNPFLGLHYPASDIPQQARALYKLNLTRLIGNINQPTSEIIGLHDDAGSLDMTHSQLRAVSPIHIQYLKNMNVASSYSISLLFNGELWGLIACHNYSPKLIDFKLRESSKLIGQLLSSALSFRQEEENKHLHDLLSNNLEYLIKELQNNEDIITALTAGKISIFNLIESEGLALFYEGKYLTFGQTPNIEQLELLTDWLKLNATENVYTSNFLSGEFAPAAAYTKIASGILYLPLSKEFDESIIWFKKEQLQEIKWAGNPDKPILIKDGYSHISPRHSFEEWKQEVTGKSIVWAAEEIKVAIKLRDEIIYAVNVKARTLRVLNEKLRLAYDELDTFSYTISHDLKNPLSVVKTCTQLLRLDESLSVQAVEILNRIEGRTDKMNFMISAILDYSKVGRNFIIAKPIDMQALIKEIVHDHDNKQDKNQLEISIGETPILYGDMVMMAQVFSNPIGNAIKYSTHKQKGLVSIEGKNDEKNICYTISDNGIGIPENTMNNVFDLFHRMDNAKDIEGTGVGLAIVKRIVEKHQGTISVKSTLTQGAVFTVCFPNTIMI